MDFLSQEWLESYGKALKEEFSPAKTTTKASAKVLELYRNTPSGKDIWVCFDWEKGVLQSFEYGEDIKTAPRDPDFRLYGEYKTWVRMLSLKDNPTDDLMNGNIEFYGNIMHFQPVMKPFVKSVLMQGAVCPNGKVIGPHVMKGISKVVDKTIFS